MSMSRAWSGGRAPTQDLHRFLLVSGPGADEGPQAWASTQGQIGSADPWKNGLKIKRRKHAKKSSFLDGGGGIIELIIMFMLYFESNQSRQV